MHNTIQTREQGPDFAGTSSVAARPRTDGRPTFAIACWLLALIAFAQLITVGAALTARNNPSVAAADTAPNANIPSGPIQPRSLEDILASVGSSPSSTSPHRAAQDDAAPPVSMAALPYSSPVAAIPSAADAPLLPAIADPVVERLVQESRALQMDGDMMRAMLKLAEAELVDPAEPAVIYQKALLYEEMGILPKAADQYQKVQQMGIKAGIYFKMAANKLIKGMDVAHAHRPVISIGPMNTRKDTSPSGSKRANVAITILARPDQQINPADVHVQVHFYDKLNGGEIKKASNMAQIKKSWADNRCDWKDPGNEETLRISYTIPEATLVDDHLLGRREFCGYVVELLYKGEVIDQQAQPRRLHSVHSRITSPINKQWNPLPWLPDDDNSLLPGKGDHGYGDTPALPPLPTR